MYSVQKEQSNFFFEHLTYYHPLHIHRSPILTKAPLTLDPLHYPNCKRRTEDQHHNFQPRRGYHRQNKLQEVTDPWDNTFFAWGRHIPGTSLNCGAISSNGSHTH